MFVSNQLFAETPDGQLTAFTTALRFSGDLLVTQGGRVVADLLFLNGTTVLFPSAPLLADGDLRWAGEADDTTTASGLWTVGTYHTAYGLTTQPVAQTLGALDRAWTRLIGQVQPDYLSQALAGTPAAIASRLKYAQGDLALLYLRQQGVTPGQVVKYEEEFQGVRSYTTTFAADSVKTAGTEAEVFDGIDDLLLGDSAFSSDVGPAVTLPDPPILGARSMLDGLSWGQWS